MPDEGYALNWAAIVIAAGIGFAAMGAMIVPRRVLGGVGHQTPSDTLNIAIVGAGGVGGENAQEFGSENIVAVCAP